MTVEEAAARIEAIARSRQVHEAIGELAVRAEIESGLEKAAGLEGMRKLAPGEVSGDPQETVSGAAVLRTLAQLRHDRK